MPAKRKMQCLHLYITQCPENEKPQSQKCSVEKTSWFFYNRRLTLGENNQDHNRMKIKLSPDLV